MSSWRWSKRYWDYLNTLYTLWFFKLLYIFTYNHETILFRESNLFGTPVSLHKVHMKQMQDYGFQTTTHTITKGLSSIQNMHWNLKAVRRQKLCSLVFIICIPESVPISLTDNQPWLINGEQCIHLWYHYSSRCRFYSTSTKFRKGAH